MAIVRAKELVKMTKEEIEARLHELRIELIKAGVTANKTKAKTRELKRAVSRCITISKLKEVRKK